MLKGGFSSKISRLGIEDWAKRDAYLHRCSVRTPGPVVSRIKPIKRGIGPSLDPATVPLAPRALLPGLVGTQYSREMMTTVGGTQVDCDGDQQREKGPVVFLGRPEIIVLVKVIDSGRLDNEGWRR
jgi:hypothetical protein